MEYRIVKSRRQTMSIEVTKSLEVVVRAPLWVSDSRIHSFARAHEAWAQQARQRVLQRLAEMPPEPTPAQAERLRRTAETILPQRTAFFGEKMGLRPAGVRITGARTRFGSCSAKNRLCFSYRLMGYPPEAIDYVVVHELAHLLHKNHGPRFYALVAEILPDYARRQALLRKNPRWDG